MKFEFITTDHALYAGEARLRFEVLRKPLGFEAGAERFEFEDQSVHLVAVENGEVVGCVLFYPDGQGSGRLYQMGVHPSKQRQGLGTALVRALEEKLASDGIRSVELHARASAADFYARLGYTPFGEPYEEVGIPHINMRRPLEAPSEN